jgi:hypothetical protein
VNGSSFALSGALEVGVSTLLMNDGGLLKGIGLESNFTLTPTAKLHILHGNMNWAGDVQIQGEIVLSKEATILWGNTTYSPVNSSISTIVTTDYLLVPAYKNVLFPVGLFVNLEFALVGNCSASVNSGFSLGNLQAGKLILATNTSLSLFSASSFISSPNGAFGTGNITISDSNANFYNAKGVSVFNGTVSISGNSNVELQQINIRNLYLGSNSDSVSVFGNNFGIAGVAMDMVL